jgi:hypothetical protein
VACLSNAKSKKVKRADRRSLRRRNAPALCGDLARCHVEISPNNEHLKIWVPKRSSNQPQSKGVDTSRIYFRTAHEFTGLHESRRHGGEIAIGGGVLVVAGVALILSFRVCGSFVFARALFLAVGCPIHEPGGG